MWEGDWHNQYGSLLRITDESAGRISGTFRTNLGDSRFAGAEVLIIGLHQGDCVQFAFARAGEDGDTICSYTGLLRDGRSRRPGTSSPTRRSNRRSRESRRGG